MCSVKYNSTIDKATGLNFFTACWMSHHPFSPTAVHTLWTYLCPPLYSSSFRWQLGHGVDLRQLVLALSCCSSTFPVTKFIAEKFLAFVEHNYKWSVMASVWYVYMGIIRRKNQELKAWLGIKEQKSRETSWNKCTAKLLWNKGGCLPISADILVIPVHRQKNRD